MRKGAVLGLLVAASLGADAAGLGKLTVNSALGQPLNAEIDLVSLQPGEMDSIQARVASPDAFRDARIEYSGVLRLLKFSVEKRANGQPYVKVTSTGPVNEPFVDVLIEISWPSGRIQREYPILLDPPGYAAKAAPPVAAAAPAPTAPAASAPASSAPATASVTPATSGSPSARGELASTPPGSDTYGPVQKGDTLMKIANEVKPSNVSLEQMLVALYKENQGAFVGNNMNRLKAGQILKVPSADEVNQLAANDARKEVRTHVADWKTYREQVASGATSMPSRPESSNTSTGRVSTAAVSPPSPPPAESKDTLKLSKSDASKAGAGKGGGSNAALQEELAAKDKALREANSRVADLEKQIKDMQRLIDLKSGAPAKPADTKTAAAPTPPPVAPAKTEPAKPAEAPKVAEVKPSEAPKADAAKPAEAPKTAEASKTAEAPKSDAAKPAEAPKVADASKATPPKTPTKAAPPKKPPPSMMDELSDNLPLIAGGVGLLALLGGGAYLFARRRKERAEAAPNSSMTSAFPSDLKPNTTTGKSGGGLVDTGNSSFLTDFDKTGPGAIDTEEVDPVAEAEVYIAYGRDAQAEEILKEALARDKTRPEIALKLLEIYHARKSATAFEQVAREFKEQVGDNNPNWQKAAAMGAQIDPQNPLYAGGAGGEVPVAAAVAAPKPDLDFDINTTSSSGQAAPQPSFDLDLDAHKPSSAAAETPHALDFDIDAASSAPAPAAHVEPVREEKPAFDFDLSSLDMPASSPAAEDTKPSAAPPSFDLTDLSLDSPGEGSGEAVGTKLELAKAYLEIGDKDGAREILQEVAKEGSSAQKEEAKKLIASL